MPKFGLIGFPVSHSKSPDLFKEACGGRYAYDLIECRDFDKAMDVFRGEDYLAVNVTAPFKTAAASVADICQPEVIATEAANILVKTDGGIKAFNSDVYAVRRILENAGRPGRVLIVGFGGAGRAALYAAQSLGLECEVCNRTFGGVRAGGVRPLSEMADLAAGCDFVIYTLPCPVEGISSLEGKPVLEANYLDPCLQSRTSGYVGGLQWLRLQAEEGFRIMLAHLNN